jgi:hypothetical protein
MGKICYYKEHSCRGKLWKCRDCGEWYCEVHSYETSKGKNVECAACERKRLIAAKPQTCICDPKRRHNQQRTNPYCKAPHADDGHLERPDETEIRMAGSED